MVNDQCVLIPRGSIQGAFSKLDPQFQNLVIEFINSKYGDMEDSSLIQTAEIGTQFLFFMQNNNLSIEEIGEDDVLRFFIKDDKIIYEASGRYRLSEFFEELSKQHPKYKKISDWIPRIRVTRKNIQYLMDDEASKTKNVCISETSSLSYCDKAVGLILLFTGLRACDIASLKVSDIDWDNEVIHIVQQKTNVPLTIPMVALVGNAIYDYIVEERNYDGDRLFVTSKGIPFKSRDISYCVNRIFKEAGIRQNKGDRKGTHIFRHHLATKLLENEVAQPVISQQLGHTDPASVETYLSADIKHLRQCALSIEPYSLNWEAFDNA